MLVSMGKVGASSLPAAARTSCWRTCKVQGVQLRLPLLKLPPEPSPFRYQWGEGTRYLQMPHPAWGRYSKFVHRDRSTSIFSIQVRTQTGHSSDAGWNLQRRWVSLLIILPSDSTVQQKEPVHCVPLEKMFPHTSSAGFGASNSQWHHWLRIPGQRDGCSCSVFLASYVMVQLQRWSVLRMTRTCSLASPFVVVAQRNKRSFCGVCFSRSWE